MYSADLPLGPIFVATGGIATVAGGLIRRDKASESRAWPSVRGRVYAARVIEVQARPFEGHKYTDYQPEIRYEFTVGGKEYAGNRYTLLASRVPWRSDAEKIVTQYPIGREVDVYYDPSDPNRCVLVHSNVDALTAGITLISGSLVFLGALVWGLMMR